MGSKVEPWVSRNTNGEKILIFSPSLRVYRKLKSYYSLFRAELNEIALKHWTDDVLYPRLGYLMQDIATLLGFDASELSPMSRIEFFVCTVKDGSLGLSGLETLLGYTDEPAPANPSPVPVLTCGYTDLDTIADLLLVFPERAEFVINEFSLQECLCILDQYTNRTDKARQKEAQKKADMKAWERVSKAGKSKLEQIKQKYMLDLFGGKNDPTENVSNPGRENHP